MKSNPIIGVLVKDDEASAIGTLFKIVIRFIDFFQRVSP